MSNFSNFNFSGRYFQSLALPNRFHPDAFQNFNYSENFFNFGQICYGCFAAVKQRSQQNRHRRIFGSVDRYFPFQLFPAVDYIICHSKTIIMFLNFLANKQTPKLQYISDSKYTVILKSDKFYLIKKINYLIPNQNDALNAIHYPTNQRQ